LEKLWLVALGVVLVNLPFGFWRQGTRKFSPSWFVAVHGPVPVVAGMRILAGVHWELRTLPVLVGAYFTGQFLGGRLRRARSEGLPRERPDGTQRKEPR